MPNRNAGIDAYTGAGDVRRFQPVAQAGICRVDQDAKTEETRLRRLETAIEWMLKGKSRHWKYANC